VEPVAEMGQGVGGIEVSGSFACGEKRHRCGSCGGGSYARGRGPA
jgi:hypothetical protein